MMVPFPDFCNLEQFVRAVIFMISDPVLRGKDERSLSSNDGNSIDILYTLKGNIQCKFM